MEANINQTNFYQFDMDTFTLMNLICRINLILMFLGIINNICSIFIFLQKKMLKRKFNSYLLVVAFCELIFCFILFIDYLFRFVYTKPMFLHDLNVYVNMVMDYLIHLSDSYVVILTLILSFDRICAIKTPDDVRFLVTTVHTKMIMASTFIALLVLKMPGVFLCYKNSEKKFEIIYCTIVSPFIFNIIPTIVIFILNLILVARIFKYYRKNKMKERRQLTATKRLNVTFRRQSNQAHVIVYSQLAFSRTQKSHFIVLIVISFWSVLTTMPYYLLNTFYLLFNLEIFSNRVDFNQINRIQIISSLFFNTNHCVNFFINLFFNFEFRNYICKFLSQVVLKLCTVRSGAASSDSFDIY